MERRHGERLSYPPHLRPVLLTEAFRLKVVDISRNAIAFVFKRDLALQTGDPFIARLRLGRRYTPVFAATVVRCTAEIVAARIEPEFETRLLQWEYERVLRQAN